jgi:AraC family transcriptional regulator of adaptative response / DNA-3-methyladenine glycosylase II
VRRALGRFESGGLDYGSLDDLARALGVSDRHLRRAFVEELGVAPLRLAHMAEPTVRLVARPPFDGAGVLAFLAARALRGVERVTSDRYVRTLAIGDRVGRVTVALAGDTGVHVSVSPSLTPVLVQVIARVRRLLDLEAHPVEIDAHLASDPLLAPSVAARPGLRVPGTLEPFELAVRVVLGQQVSVAAARTLATRLVDAFGQPFASDDPDLRLVFPSAVTLASASVEVLGAIGLTRARAATLRALAVAVAEEQVDLQPGADPAEVVEQLDALPGIGPWTAEMIAMRASGWPDAFPVGDLGIRRRLGAGSDTAARAAAERWRPWRAYAVLHLWVSEQT